MMPVLYPELRRRATAPLIFCSAGRVPGQAAAVSADSFPVADCQLLLYNETSHHNREGTTISAKKSKTKKNSPLTQKQIIRKYGLTKNQIQRYLPRPQVKQVRGRGGSYWTVGIWPAEQVEKALQGPELAHVLEEREAARREQRQIAEIRALFEDYSPESYIERARQLRRTFVLHVGPTNSGKTHDAIEDLKRNLPGTYLGPLRLLALEMFDRINAAGIPCSMLTGEESIPVENAQIVSSTIELCDYRTHYKTAVIDEAQLIADPGRGA